MNDTPVRALCSTHHGPHTPQPTPGTHTCRPCRDRIHHHTLDTARLYTHALTITTPGSQTPRGGGRRGPASTPPTNIDALDTLIDTTLLIHDWCHLIADERHFRLPHPDTHHRIQWLATQTDWLTTHRAIPDYAREIAAQRARLRTLVGEARTVIATCQEPHPDPHTPGECGGPLLHHPDHPTHPVRCAECGATWTTGAITLALQQQAHAATTA